MQHINPDILTTFQAVEDKLRGTFLPDHFQGATSHIPRRTITGMTVKQARISLPEPTRIPGGNWTAFYMIMGQIVAALRWLAKFRSGNHALLMGEGREEIRRRHEEEAVTDPGEARAAASKPYAHQLGRI